MYPYLDEIVEWIKHKQNLFVALITNGTLTDRIKQETWDSFSWVRVSLNFFENYKNRIKFPNVKNGILGCSMVYTGQTLSEMKELSAFVDNDKVSYIRILPNCLLEQEKLLDEHKKIADLLSELNDNRFFQQFKLHGTPCASVCHQAYFRPYLSEVDGGTVFPCDSLVLNDEIMHFNKKYSICSWNKVLDFLDGKIKMKFNAEKDCEGCVFTSNIKLLEEWIKDGKNEFENYRKGIPHEEFV
jgi:MoaA/NifB/PqqE/SkfB family radical SAM enzyme